MGGILAVVLLAVLTSVFAPLLVAHVRRDAADITHRVAQYEALRASYVRAALAPSCAHRDAVPVDLLLTGERVAWWCEACQTQLEPGFDPAPPSLIIKNLGGGGGSSAFTGVGITITAAGGSTNTIHYSGRPASDGGQAGPATFSDS
jgi:hypothetical protein